MPFISSYAMKFDTVFDRHTDFISDRLSITCWSFDIDGLKTNPDSGDYSHPVRKALFAALARIARSGNRRIRERSFTLFMGDHGPGFIQFGVGIRGSTFRAVKDIFESEFAGVNGYEYETNGRLPYTPLVPCYRYIHGAIIEYTGDSSLAGKKHHDEDFSSGLTIRYRKWLSAETEGLKPRYIRKG